MLETPNTPDPAALVIMHAGKIASIEANKDEIMGAFRSAHARAQNDGLNLEAFKAARKIAKNSKRPEKVIEAEKTLALTIFYLRVLYPDAFTQVSIEDYLNENVPDTEGDAGIFQEGRRAALMQTATQPPMGYNDTQAGHWGEGWKQGNQERIALEEMAAQNDAAEDEPSDDLDDEELAEDQPVDEEVQQPNPEPATNVAQFADAVEKKASGEMPDQPPSSAA